MEDTKVIKNIFSIETVSTIEDTEDDKVGEAQINYQFNIDGSLPELGYAFAGFLQMIDSDPNMNKTIEAGTTAGKALLDLITLYYNKPQGVE